MTAWGFLVVIVACLAVAWAYLRKRVVVDVVEDQRAALERAREDAAAASAQRSRTAGQIAAQGEPKVQAAAVAAVAHETADRISGDAHAQASAVADLIGAPPPVALPQTRRTE